MNSIFNISDDDINLFITSYNKNLLNGTVEPQIPMYVELLKTIKDCLNKAKYPERLTFGIAWQHSDTDEWDTLDEYKKDPRFKILDIDYSQSEGVCWARNKINIGNFIEWNLFSVRQRN